MIFQILITESLTTLVASWGTAEEHSRTGLFQNSSIYIYEPYPACLNVRLAFGRTVGMPFPSDAVKKGVVHTASM